MDVRLNADVDPSPPMSPKRTLSLPPRREGLLPLAREHTPSSKTRPLRALLCLSLTAASLGLGGCYVAPLGPVVVRPGPAREWHPGEWGPGGWHPGYWEARP